MDKDGYDIHQIEKGLSKQGFYLKKRQRNEKFTVLESRIYIVDDTFPRMNLNNISGVKNKEQIIKITYTLDLTGLNYIELI